MNKEHDAMKKIILAGMLMVLSLPAGAEEMKSHEMMSGMKMHGMQMNGMKMGDSAMAGTEDSRTSLNLPAPMRFQQKQMMREHLQAVNDIIALIAERKFDAASDIAHSKLGLTPEMKKMCNMFANDNFRQTGLTFHKHADELGDVLKTKNLNKSLRALNTVMDSCIKCHATFRQ